MLRANDPHITSSAKPASIHEREETVIIAMMRANIIQQSLTFCPLPFLCCLISKEIFSVFISFHTIQDLCAAEHHDKHFITN